MSASLESSPRKRRRAEPADASGKSTKKPRKSPSPTDGVLPAKSKKPNERLGEKGVPINGIEKPTKRKTSEPRRDQKPNEDVNGRDDEGTPSEDRNHLANLDLNTHIPDSEVNGIALSKTERKRSKPERRRLDAERDLYPKPIMTTEKIVAKAKEPSTWSWITSEPLCGRFLDQDPIFSHNEKYLLLPTSRSLNIYAASSSFLIRTLDSESFLVQARLSKLDPEIVYMATVDGCITIWNWVSGQRLVSLPLKSTICGFEVVAKDEENEQLFLLLENGDETSRQWRIAFFDVSSHEESFDPKIASLHSTSEPLQFLSVVCGGSTIFAASRTKVFVGVQSDGEDLKDARAYNWNTFEFKAEVSSFDVRVEKRKAESNEKGADQSAVCRLAIGSRLGSIFLYEDILNLLQQTSELSRFELHWHREAVLSVKWSADGNYLISGGKETVLCLWQLETGRKQYLPHLSAAVQGIVVSPRGTSYGLRLADNSVMVISTSELAPKTMVAGLQSRLLPEFPTAYAHAKSLASKHLTTPAVEHKFSPGRILLAVPVSQDEELYDLPSLPFLQTYDTSINRHISRQALARNNVTNFTKNPDGVKIKEANVTMMKLSCDGRWLATVEQWMPPAADVEYLVHDYYSKKEERMRRRETYLKFWLWNNEKKSWRLECRIDAPHQSESIGSENETLDLVPDPARLGFATIGEDGIVRVWRPKTRLRDGRVRQGVWDGLTTWVCAQMIDLGRTGTLDMSDRSIRETPERAKLAFSDDGSVLAASQDGGADALSPGLVHFIATRTGAVNASQALMYTGALAGMLFLDRHLVVLSSLAVHVWDTVTNDLVYALPLPASDVAPPLVPALSHLAASPTHARFLVAVPATGPAAGPQCPGATVFVLEPGSAAPCLRAEMSAPVTAAVPLAAAAGGGFALLDAAGELRIVRPRGAVAVDPVRLAAALEDAQAAAEAEAEAVEGAADVVMGDAGLDEAVEGADDVSDGESEGDGEDDGRPVVRAEKLAVIFDGAPAFALPPVQELFDSVVRLYVGRKRAGGT